MSDGNESGLRDSSQAASHRLLCLKGGSAASLLAVAVWIETHLYPRLVEHPAPNDLISTNGAKISPPALMTILFARLDVQRLSEELALLNARKVNALL